jgi:hypothetical protein
MFRLFLLSGLGAILTGCGFQRGQVSMSGESTEALLGRFGCVQIVTGYHLKTMGLPRDDDGNLLYIVIIGPTMLHGEANEARSDAFTNETFTTVLSHSWDDGGHSSSVSLRWDRRTDTISAGKFNFARQGGDVFLLQLATNGDIYAQQFPSLDPNGGPHQVLQYLRQKLPNDEALASVKLLNDPR